MNVERFGLELEFVGIPRAAAASSIESALSSGHVHSIDRNTRVCELCKSHVSTADQHTAWSVINDETVRTQDGNLFNTGEVVSPILTSLDMGDVASVTAALRSAGATVNSTTGLHVHVDVSNLPVDELIAMANKWFAVEPFMFAKVHPRRRNDKQCAPYFTNQHEKSRILDALRDQQNGQRFMLGATSKQRSLNFQSYHKYGTFEVRLHQGTLRFDTIITWVSALLKLFNGQKVAA